MDVREMVFITIKTFLALVLSIGIILVLIALIWAASTGLTFPEVFRQWFSSIDPETVPDTTEAALQMVNAIKLAFFKI